MTDDVLSLQATFACALPDDQDLFRRAAAAAQIPVEVVEADGLASTGRLPAGGVDLVFVDGALGDDAVGKIIAAARGAAKPPFTVLLAEPGAHRAFKTDALANKPLGLEKATQLIDRSARVRIPSRVLIVDDSTTMRSIIRKILNATRFPLDVSEVGRGGEALELTRQTEFDLILLDYYMPGFTGLETMGEIRREWGRTTFVLISSAQDDAVAKRARALGAGFLKKPFYLADLEAVLCDFYGLRALNPQRV
jgi:CheY-like chemotaxis protein